METSCDSFRLYLPSLSPSTCPNFILFACFRSRLHFGRCVPVCSAAMLTSSLAHMDTSQRTDTLSAVQCGHLCLPSEESMPRVVPDCCCCCTTTTTKSGNNSILEFTLAKETLLNWFSSKKKKRKNFNCYCCYWETSPLKAGFTSLDWLNNISSQPFLKAIKSKWFQAVNLIRRSLGNEQVFGSSSATFFAGGRNHFSVATTWKLWCPSSVSLVCAL